MVDRFSRANTGAILSPNLSLKVATNIASGSQVTDWIFNVDGYLEIYTPSLSFPGQDSVELVFAWETVNTGVASTPLTSLNVWSGPWVWSAYTPLQSESHAFGITPTSTNIFAFGFAGAHKLWFPQQPGAAFDVWIHLWSGWSAYYGLGPSISVNAEIKYYGP